MPFRKGIRNAKPSSPMSSHLTVSKKTQKPKPNPNIPHKISYLAIFRCQSTQINHNPSSNLFHCFSFLPANTFHMKRLYLESKRFHMGERFWFGCNTNTPIQKVQQQLALDQHTWLIEPIDKTRIVDVTFMVSLVIGTSVKWNGGSSSRIQHFIKLFVYLFYWKTIKIHSKQWLSWCQLGWWIQNLYKWILCIHLKLLLLILMDLLLGPSQENNCWQSIIKSSPEFIISNWLKCMLRHTWWWHSTNLLHAHVVDSVCFFLMCFTIEKGWKHCQTMVLRLH